MATTDTVTYTHAPSLHASLSCYDIRAAGLQSATSLETRANGAAARRIAPPLHLPRFGAMTLQMDHDHGSYYRRYFGQAFYTSKDRRIAPFRSGPQLQIGRAHV